MAVDAVNLYPRHAGNYACAWRRKRERGHPANLVDWIIEAPHAHPSWHSYILTLVHLRDGPGLQPAKRILPDATHQMWLYALDPRKPRESIIRGETRPSVLTPLNFAAQLVEPSDERALARIESAVVLICDGTLSPDTDALAQWIALFGDNIVQLKFRSSPSAGVH